jgi:hypothetical protein
MSAEHNSRADFEAYDASRRVFLLTAQLKSRCKYADKRFEKVSKWSVGQHIEHVLAVNAKAVLVLSCDEEAPAKPAAGLTPAGQAVFASGLIPRGMSQAPESVQPRMTNYVDLADDVERNTNLLDGLAVINRQIAADANTYAHPALGGMTKMQWLRFLEIHIEHHLKIIADICGQNDPSAPRLSPSGRLTLRAPDPPARPGVPGTEASGPAQAASPAQ